MYGFIEVVIGSTNMSIAVCHIQSVFYVSEEKCTKILCADSTYTTSETYDEIMKKIRAEIIWVLRNTKEDSTNATNH